jgi:beta-galactosidase
MPTQLDRQSPDAEPLAFEAGCKGRVRAPAGGSALPLGGPAPSARVTGATTRAGRRLWFVSNWAWEPVTVLTPVAGTCLLSGRGVRKGRSVELGAWDVDVVAEA